MKVLFCHDFIMYKNKNHCYNLGFGDEILSRYYAIGDELCVMSRFMYTDDTNLLDKLSKVTLKKFKHIEICDFNGVKNIFNATKAKKLIYEAVENADYIVARVPSLISNIAIDAAKKYSKPYMVEVVGCAWDAYWNHSFVGKLCAPYLTYAMKKRVKSAPGAIYVTNEFLQRRYPTSGKQFSCSNVALTAFDDESLKKRLLKIENNKGSMYTLGTVAAIDVKYKGQHRVIKALGKMKKKGIKNFKYEVVGGGNPDFLKKEINKYDVADLVEIKGTMPHNEVFNWLDTIDIYVQPSRQEGLPRALIEAMSRGVPSIGSSTGGIPELLDNQFIFNRSCKTKEIIKVLKKLITDDMQEIAKMNYEKSKKYDVKKLEKIRYDAFTDFRNGKIK